MYLAAAGVGTIGIVDADAVDLSNLQRQIIHQTADLGKAKVESAKETMNAMNPDVVVNTYREFVYSDNIQDLIRRNIKYVWFGLTNDGYFVAYIPESWQELWFDTVMDFQDEYYGHLLIKYDPYGLRETTPYHSTDPGMLPIDNFWSKDELMPYVIEGNEIQGMVP